LFASRDLPSGFAIRLPRRFVLGRTVAMKTRLGRRIESLALSDEELLCTMLADACFYDTHNSPFGAFARSLAADAPDAANWPASDLSLLEGTDLGVKLSGEDASLTLLRARLHSCGVHIEVGHLRWARGMWRSRAFGRASTDDDDNDESVLDPEIARACEPAFCPLFDLLNHSDTAEVAFDATSNKLVLSNEAPLKRGEEAFNSYGEGLPNEELLSDYGFTRARNPHDSATLVLKSVGPLLVAQDGAFSEKITSQLAHEHRRETGELARELQRAIRLKLAALDVDHGALNGEDSHQHGASDRAVLASRHYRDGVKRALRAALSRLPRHRAEATEGPTKKMKRLGAV
jgi:hypothetical protein